MTQAPGNSPDKKSSSPSRHRWIGRLVRTFLVLGVVLAGAAGAGTWWMWRYVNSDLTPQMEKQVGKILKRPVTIGSVEEVTPFGIRFGPSEIPNTATETDRVVSQAVEVRFNPLQLLGGKLDLNVTLVDPDIYLEQDETGEWVDPELNISPGNGPVQIGLKTLKLRRGNVRAVPFWQGETNPAAAVDLEDVTGKLKIGSDSEQLKFEADGQVVGQPGRIKTSGTSPSQNPRINFQIKGKDLLVADMKRVLENTVPFPEVALGEGRVDADLDITFTPGDPDVEIEGDATFRGTTAKVPQLPLPVKNAEGKVRIKDKDIQVLNATGTYGSLEFETQGQVHLEDGLDMTAKVKPLEVNAALETAAVTLPVAVAGMAIAEDLRITGMADSPIVTGKVRSAQTMTVDQVPFQEASSRFVFKNSVINLSEIRAVPNSGGLISGSGSIDLNPGGAINIKTSATGLNGDDLVKRYNENGLPVTIGTLTAQTKTVGPVDRPRTTVQFQALEADYPARGVAQIEDGTVKIDDLLLRVAEGTVRGVGKLQGDRWSGTAKLSGVRLNQFSPDLRGQLNGDVALGGPVQGFSPSNLDADGTVTFSEGIALVNDPLVMDLRWDGPRSQMIVANATAPGLTGSGTVGVDVTDTPEITTMDLDVTARGYDLRSLPLASPDAPVALDLGGFANFDGRITGSLETLQAKGDLRLSEFQLNNLPFESSLAGTVAYTPNGTQLNLAGNRDRIDLNLDSEFMPRDFVVQQGAAIAQGSRTGPDQYDIDLQEFNLAALNIRPNTGLGDVPLEGLASGSAQVALSPLTASGNLQILNPALGNLRGTALKGKFDVANGMARLTETVLTQDLCRRQRGNSCVDPVQTRYILEKGELALGAEPSFDVAIAIDNGDTQGLLRMVQWFEFGDITQGVKGAVYGSADDLSLTGLGLPDAPLFNQLQRFSEVKQLVAKETIRQRNESRYPALSELSGPFDGRIEAKGTVGGAFQSSFDLNGTNWAWGRYDVDSVSLQGEFSDGLLTLLPLRITDGDAVVSFSGQLGGEQQSGQLQAANVPVSLARNFIDLPVDLGGDLNMQANVAGSSDNPRAIGSINLNNGSLNGTPVKTEQVGFNYVNARLSFGGSLGIAVTEEAIATDPRDTELPTDRNAAQPSAPEPLRISGSIPLPFGSMQPADDQIALNVDVKNEGLAFLNLISRDQLQWRGGEGQVQLKVDGTINNPIATGTATFKNATLAAQVLPDAELTNFNGLVRFNQDRIRVDGLDGIFSDGRVMAKGTIPISRTIPVQDPLTVGFRELDLNLRGLYRGGASGDVTINGTALRPDLAGRIVLENGQVLLPEPSTAEAQTSVVTALADDTLLDSGSTPIRVPTFDNLQLTLGKKVRVASQPLFSFLAEGNLGLTGDLDNPLLDGDILLTKGNVNLFTTNFNLARRSRNVASFTPERGLNPYLQVELVTAVTEVSRSRSTFDNVSTSEISDAQDFDDFGSLQTVRVRAKVDGPASTLLDNITLASSPSRSQGEIISLIGGGFVDTLGRGGDSTLALANLAGSALLGNIQSVINNALTGPVEVRIFPAIVDTSSQRERADNDGETNSVFALGSEIGVNINNSLSFSALKLLTVDLPAQFNLRYQLNDNLTLRATTDLQGESRAVVEYEQRF